MENNLERNFAILREIDGTQVLSRVTTNEDGEFIIKHTFWADAEVEFAVTPKYIETETQIIQRLHDSSESALRAAINSVTNMMKEEEE